MVVPAVNRIYRRTSNSFYLSGYAAELGKQWTSSRDLNGTLVSNPPALLRSRVVFDQLYLSLVL